MLVKSENNISFFTFCHYTQHQKRKNNADKIKGDNAVENKLNVIIPKNKQKN